MSKARETVAFQGPLTSAQTNQAYTDYIVPGNTVWHFDGTVVSGHTPAYMGWYLYNEAKQIHDRMRILGASFANGAVSTSIDGGTTWQALALGSAGVPVTALVTYGDSGGANTSQLTFGDVNLSGIVGAQWIGARFAFAPLGAQVNYWCLLYNSLETPF